VYGAAAFENVDPGQIAPCRIAARARVPQVWKILIWIIRNNTPPEVACVQAMERRVRHVDQKTASAIIGTT